MNRAYTAMPSNTDLTHTDVLENIQYLYAREICGRFIIFLGVVPVAGAVL